MSNHASFTAQDSHGTGQRVLAGIRVLDLSRVLAGPFCGQLLADFGAEVIKVERPEVGDDSRAWGPPYLAAASGAANSESAFFCACNRGKQSVTIDIANPDGRDLVGKLVAHADVLIENYKVGTLARHGLGYAELSAINPKLIYCSITGFGQTGPYRHKPGYDTIVQALGGLMSITGEADERPGGGPLKAGIAAADLMTGLYSALAVLAALRHRDATGAGQHIDMSLLDVQVSALANIGMNYLVSGKVPQRNGNRLPTVYPSDAFRCKDGELMLIVGNNQQFARFCARSGLDDLTHDARFATNALRVEHAELLHERISAVLVNETVQEWCTRFDAVGVPCGPINNLAQVFADPQVQARGLRQAIMHPQLGAVPTIANPLRFSASPVQYGLAPPTLGQHTHDVLRDVLGLTNEELARLSAGGAI